MTYHPRFLPLLLAVSLSALLPGHAPCRAAPLTVLHTFCAGSAIRPKPGDHQNVDGARPLAALIQGRDGTLYGTAANGGAHGGGAVFRVNPDGTGFTVLHPFDALNFSLSGLTNSGGAWPSGLLVQAANGTLYGAVEMGGSAGSGLIYKVQPDGTGFQVVHSFGRSGEWVMGRNGDGVGPAALTLAADGLLYGVARYDGTDGGGVVFRLGQDGRGFNVLHAFRGVVHDKGTNEGGAQPESSPVVGSDGALYGTTYSGGKDGFGVIYRLTIDGKQFTVLHHFQCQGPVSEVGSVFPEGTLTASADGFLYGSTRQGGANDGGTLFKISQQGTGFTILHSFPGLSDDGGDGRLPAATPILGRDGRLYGLTGAGGANTVGTAFWASTDGSKFVVIHDFGPPDASWHNADGAYPRAGLLQGRDGALYGVAAGGGLNGTGTVFRLMPPITKPTQK